MQRIVVDCSTGSVSSVEMTPEEVAEAQEAAAEWAANQPQKIRLYKADIWRRATDAEAATIDAMLTSLPVRLRRMWSDATFLSKNDALFAMIEAAATQTFGPARAAELLQPTE